jgi:Sulfotransferase family
MLGLMQNNSARWRSDGLSDLRMTVTGDATTITHWDSVSNWDSASLNNHTVLHPGVAATLQATTTTITRKHFVSAKQQGSIISSLSIAPAALASFAAIHHIKAIPKFTALEFLHVTQTDGGRIERAGANGGISWGACHFHHALEVAMKCPDRNDPELEGRLRFRSKRASITPWHSPLQDFEENPYKGRPTFAVVRNPYDRLIDFFYCPWNGYKGDRTPNATDLNLFLQNAMYPEPPGSSLTEGEGGGKKTDAPKPTPEAFLFLRPQFHYVFASNQIALYSRPFVTHILRFETIEEDFGNLMRLYNLQDKVHLPARAPSSAKYAKTLTPLHFDEKTRDMIHRFYAGDFARFNYSQMHHKPNHR